ncbi:helix-turn-helix domain-containing protein [Epibacterium sp. DP7N7-1]|nr:helix-turn-helix domain-containing protein [Epibacterium sp. DP7N7-1]
MARTKTAPDGDIKERLHAAMTASGINQSELARRSGLTRENISRYMTGRTAIPDKKMVKLASVLGVSPSSIAPNRQDLDDLVIPGPVAPHFNMRPSGNFRSGKVHLELSAELDVAIALRVVELITQTPQPQARPSQEIADVGIEDPFCGPEKDPDLNDGPAPG